MARKSLWKKLFSKNKKKQNNFEENTSVSTEANFESVVINEGNIYQKPELNIDSGNKDKRSIPPVVPVQLKYASKAREQIQKVEEVPAQTFFVKKLEQAHASIDFQTVTVSSVTVMEPEIKVMQNTDSSSDEEKKRKAAEDMKRKLKLGLFGGDNTVIGLLYHKTDNKDKLQQRIHVNNKNKHATYSEIALKEKDKNKISHKSKEDLQHDVKKKTPTMPAFSEIEYDDSDVDRSEVSLDENKFAIEENKLLENSSQIKDNFNPCNKNTLNIIRHPLSELKETKNLEENKAKIEEDSKE